MTEPTATLEPHVVDVVNVNSLKRGQNILWDAKNPGESVSIRAKVVSCRGPLTHPSSDGVPQYRVLVKIPSSGPFPGFSESKLFDEDHLVYTA